MDLDFFDNILGENVTKNVRAGGKFQPKAKPREVKKNSGSTPVSDSQPVPSIDVSESVFNALSRTEKPGGLSDHDRSFGVVNVSLQRPPTTENVNSAAALDLAVDGFIPNSNDDWHSCFENPMGESADIFIGLESLGDFLPDSTTVLDNSVPSSEAPNVHVSDSGNGEDRLSNPLNSAVDNSASMSNIHNIPSASQDPLTGTDPIVATDGSLTDNRNLETVELQTYPCLETLDMSRLTSSFGPPTGKFQPKSKMQAHRQRNNIDIHGLNVAHPVKYHLDAPVPPRVDIVDPRSGPAFTPDNVIDFSSIGLSHAAPSQSTSEADEELLNFVGASNQEAGVPGEHLEDGHGMPGKLTSCRANTGKGKTCAASDHSAKEQMASISNETTGAGRSLRKRKNPINTHKLVDESDNEGLEDGDAPAESLSNSIVNEDDIADEEFQLEDEPQKKKVRNKSKKSEGDKEKPIRKRKKDTELSEQAAKAAPKKFSHSSRRRKVDKALLETPEDEIDIRKVPLRDLILLAEHKEQMAKETKASQAPLQNQSNGNHTVDGNEDDAGNGFEPFGENGTFASAQGGEANDDEESLRDEESPTYFNYQTYMDKTPRSRWSKQDTELFYQAVRQFGTDLSMIQHLFPGRTRRQIKLKYKKEERQNPLLLHEVLSNPAKDHSHFELVIERLKQIAAEENQNTSRADSISLTGEEEIDEETTETNVNMDEEVKSEQIEEAANNTKPDFSETQSPVVSHDSDDDFLRWSQYKSEL